MEFVTTDDLKADLLRLIDWRGDGLSFAEIMRYLPKARGDNYLDIGIENVWLWDKVSNELILVLKSLFDSGLAYPKGCSPVSYLADGVLVGLPVARSARPYKEPHWLPVLICKGRDSQ